MDWFKCHDCGATCNTLTVDTIEDTETSEFWGAVATTTTVQNVCPDCRSEELEDWTPCSNCVDLGREFPGEPMFGADDCIDCSREVLDEEELLDLIRYGDDHREAQIMARHVRRAQFRKGGKK